MLIKILIVLVMIAILFSLFRALYFLVTDGSGSKRTVNNLSWRIGLSIALFVFIVAGIFMGWIEPHGLPDVKPN